MKNQLLLVFRALARSAKRLARAIVVAAFIVTLTLRGTARAGGMLQYETGAPDLGTASAGRAAMAADASTAASNPAGMTLLDRSQLLVAAGAVLPSSNFDLAPQTTTPGGGGGNAGVFVPLGSGAYVYKLSDRVRLGVAVNSNFGGAFNYGKKWAGRYYLTELSLITAQVNPSIAYRVNEWLSVGAGFSFEVARLFEEAKIHNPEPERTDGGLELESWDEAFGGNVGILLQPVRQLRIGLTYQSPLDFKFGFRPHLTGLGPALEDVRKKIGGAKINVGLTQPQQFMASAVYQITSKLALLANLGWQNWAELGSIPVAISTTKQTSLTANLRFSDTWQIAIGQQYRIGENWLWSAGFAYDSSPVSQANRIPYLPFDRQLRYGSGIQYVINKNLTGGLAWEFMDAGSAPLSVNRGDLAGTLQGHYSTNYINFVALNLIWKF